MENSSVVKEESRLRKMVRYMMEFCGISPVIASVFSVLCDLWSSVETEDGGRGVKERSVKKLQKSEVTILHYSSWSVCVCVYFDPYFINKCRHKVGRV